MKKILIIVFAGIFVIPYSCESYVSLEAKIDKRYGDLAVMSKDVYQTDSVSMGYDPSLGVISITTIANKKDVTVQIYKNGILVYEDWDNVSKGTSLNYTMTDDEHGEYDVYVGVEDGTDIKETIVKE